MIKDLFSLQAEEYSKYRPDYPEELLRYILSFVNKNGVAWDCATGNGQVASAIAHKFTCVYATDISINQLRHTKTNQKITYLQSPAEKTPFKNDYFDLVTIAQAIHWFDFEYFFDELKRVTKAGAPIAIWGYNLLRVTTEIDKIINHLYSQVLGKYWAKERAHIESEYSNIPFPFKNMQSKTFENKKHFTLAALEGYLNTWSSVQSFIAQHQYNPVNIIMPEIRAIWGTEEKKEVVFPIFLKLAWL